MLQDRQIDRMILKMQRLQSMYEGHLVTEEIDPAVMMTKNGIVTPVAEGMRWGEDFALATFSFTVEGINETMDSFTGMYQFSVDTTAPGLLLSSPQGGGFFSGTSVTVSGITEAYAKLVISVTDGATTEIFADEKNYSCYFKFIFFE